MTLADDVLSHALAASSRRNTCTVHGGHRHLLRRTVVALAAGQTVNKHENLGAATVQVLHSRVRLTAGAMRNDDVGRLGR